MRSSSADIARPAVGLLACGLFFMGQFALFTDVRPFLEGITRVNVATLSTVLLVIGMMGVVRTLPNDAEAGGGLMVAIIQLAITPGGLMYDHRGWHSTFALSAGVLLCASALTFAASRKGTMAR